MIFSLQLLSEMEADLICFADAIIDWKIYKICRTFFLECKDIILRFFILPKLYINIKNVSNYVFCC